MADHPHDAERLHAGACRRVGAKDHALELPQFLRSVAAQAGRRADCRCARVPAPRRAAPRRCTRICRVGQAPSAAIDMADDVGVGLEHDILRRCGPSRESTDRPCGWCIEVMPYLRAQAIICRPVGPSLTPPRPTSPRSFTPASASSRKSSSTMPCSMTGAPAMDLHAVRAEGGEGSLRRDRQRLQADDVARPARRVDFACRNHGGDAAMQVRIDPADLVLPRRPVAGDRMDMVVDQARRDRAALRVDDRVAPVPVSMIPGLADAVMRPSATTIVSASRIGCSSVPHSIRPILRTTSLVG